MGAFDETMRIDRWISQAWGVSRSEARRWLKAGSVAVGARVVRDAAFKVPRGADVRVDGVVQTPPGAVYLMLNKPLGVICATHDRALPTVIGLIDAPFAARLRVVGRLDRETSGLLLLTDDGDFNHRVARPGGEKVYRVTLSEPLGEVEAERLRAGVRLRGETRAFVPLSLECLADDGASDGRMHWQTHWRMAIGEGRYHQVRRMFAAVGAHVLALHRERIGGLALDPQLGPGDWRALSLAEREAALMLPERDSLP